MIAARNHTIIFEAEFNINLGVVDQFSNDLVNEHYFVDWAKKNILEAIDHHAENLIDPNSVIDIENLEIEIDITSANFFGNDKQGLKAVIWDKIYYELKKAIDASNTVSVSIQQYESNRVLKFINTGQLRIELSMHEWDQSIALFFSELLINKAVRQEWLISIQEKDAFIRFFNLKKDYIITQWIDDLTEIKNVSKKLKIVYRLICSSLNYFSHITELDFYHNFFKQIFHTHREEYLTDESIDSIIQKISSQLLKVDEVNIVEFISTKITKQEIKELFNKETILKKSSLETEIKFNDKNLVKEVIEDGTHVSLVGLVIVCAFLPQFLKTLGYIGSEGEIQNQKAIPILLHYLVTGEKEAPEWKLTLAKVLSGLRPNEYCNTQIKPSEIIDAEIDKFLKAIIHHWDTLKNTSPDGFREAFLKREGVLKFKNGFYYLYVEGQTVDILLNYVTWNYTTIRLNWMKQILFVEWNKN
ncbi:contractile injection system tape measure protein [uncultured Lacinutrix sp.]|uniref:contractile injection system tape measure protein n=1 Tax=uncultured Lacinutrix sp. TaxID=574032 RepID=UPI002620A278|nr:contractile injection system tape measure protein [uncultured Lacinutrix sp.]